GLMDGIKLSERLHKTVEAYSGWEVQTGALPDLSELIGEQQRLKRNNIHPTFSSAFFVRMLFSCLVDADFIETERFYAHTRGEPPPARGGYLTPNHLDAIRNFLARYRCPDTPVDI